jgi:hypothetical protein
MSLFEEVEQTSGRVPADEGAGVVGGSAGVEEPDAAFGLELLEEGAAVGGEEEGDLELAPGGAGGGVRR